MPAPLATLGRLREEAGRSAAPHRLELTKAVDLSPFQRLGRPRDRFISTMKPLFRRMAPFSLWCQSLLGGDALQTCHRRGLLRYELLVFEKTRG